MKKLLERFRELLYTSDRPLEQRMFLLGSVVAAITLLAVLVIAIAGNQGMSMYLVLVVLVVILVFMTVFVDRTGNTAVGGVVLSVIIGLIAFPAGYLLGGGAHSGTSIWFVIAIAFLATIFRTHYFWFYAIISSAVFGAIAYFSYYHPEMVTPLSDPDLIYADTTIPAIIVAIMVSLLLRYTRRIYNAESELAEKQKQEIQALSDAQSRFFSSMSHEIRTPLNTIIGLNEMTLRDPQISEEVAENSTNIQNASKMLLSLINDVLDLSKIESGRMELSESQYETSRMLSDIVNLLWSRAREKGLHFEVNVGESVPSMLYGDEMRL
ncbi:MAG: hypothetical protein IJ131_08765, partial [Eggerthellaceae bacterium]|nr:hypothetical protein [Eggerthellaceae bacterium]